MGKLNTEEPTIHHFSHKHPLQLTNHNPNLTLAPSSCSGCKVPLTQGLTYTCTLCNYFLHIKCSQMPQQIKHPSDQSHVFSLLPVPKYPEGVFKCDACGERGSGFSYHCKDCGTDLHILCASMPLLTTHHSHHHNMNLIFSPPYLNKSFSCDVCRKNGGSHWLYRCNLCEFDAHLGCGTSKAPPPQARPTAQMHQYQHAPSFSVSVVQPPPQVPAYPQQFSQGYRAAPGMPTPGAPLMNVTSRMHQHLQQQTLGVPVPVVQPMDRVNPYPQQQFLPGYGATTPGTPQMTQHPIYCNPSPNAAFQPNNQGTPGFYPSATQDTGRQSFQGQMPDRGAANDAMLQALQQLLSGANSNAQLMQAILDANNNASNANAQLLQTILNNNGGCGGGGGGNDQLIQGLMGGGGGGFDVSSLLGGNFDLSSLMGLMGGFGLS